MHQDTEPHPWRPDHTLAEILASAGIDKHSVIRVTGSAGLAALLWFCRHGYEQVGYVRNGPSPADGGDLLIVPQTCDLEGLGRLLDQGPHVRLGGVLIVQTPEPRDPVHPDPAHRLLHLHGYSVERCLHGRRRELHVARRQAAHALAEAA